MFCTFVVVMLTTAMLFGIAHYGFGMTVFELTPKASPIVIAASSSIFFIVAVAVVCIATALATIYCLVNFYNSAFFLGVLYSVAFAAITTIATAVVFAITNGFNATFVLASLAFITTVTVVCNNEGENPPRLRLAFACIAEAIGLWMFLWFLPVLWWFGVGGMVISIGVIWVLFFVFPPPYPFRDSSATLDWI